ncbi:hypothetical protein APZ41_005355 [Roseomonas mucosa]|uniref:HTH cro/C1-type domain-containing protein n=2 Tax=Roseomonas mucosa TaxID=207340 RepID=A0A1S8D9H4_9PROT|nr:hypothetical protein APZ41_005355 [Roseomonas mucosa]
MLFSGRFLQGARIMAGLTQAQLAQAAGLGESVVANIERGSSDPLNSTLMKLVEVLAEHGVQMIGFSEGVLGGVLVLDKRPGRSSRTKAPLAAGLRLPVVKPRKARATKKAGPDRG